MARASLFAWFAFRSVVLACPLMLGGCFLVPSENASFHNVDARSDSSTGQTLIPLRAKSLSLHSNTSCAISTEDELLCWGARGAKIPTADFYAFSAVKIDKTIASDSFINYSFAKVQEIVQDASDICAVSAVAGFQGTVGCWGINAGQKLLWNPLTGTYPQLTKLSMGQGFGCGIEAGGELGCFGVNEWGTGRSGVPYHYVTRPRLGEFLGTAGSLSFGGIVYTTAVQADGKILLGGSFSTYAGVTSHGIVRLNPDGSVDPTFVSRAPASSIVRSIVFNEQSGVQKIILGGNFTGYDGVTLTNLVQILPSGAIDSVTNLAANVNTGGSIGSVLVMARQTVGGVPTYLVGGTSSTYRYQSGTLVAASVGRLFRIDANGIPMGAMYSAIAKPVISIKVAANDDVYVGTQGTDATIDPAKIYRFLGTQTAQTGAIAVATSTVPYAVEVDLTHNLLYVGGNKGLHCYSATMLSVCPSWDISVGMGTDPSFTAVTLTPGGNLIAAANTAGNAHYVVDLARGTSPHLIFRYGFIDGGNVQSLHSSTGPLFVSGSFTDYQGVPAYGIMELAGDFSRKISHPVLEVQAAGDGACAIATPNGTDRNLYCWGRGYFRDVGGNSISLGKPAFTLANVENFLLTPGKLCAKVNGESKWKCRGANYQVAGDPMGSDGSGASSAAWLSINELNETPQPSLMLASSHLASGTYRVSPVNISYSEVDMGGGTFVGTQYFDARPFGCRIAGGKAYCHLHSDSATGLNSHRLGLFPANAWSEVGLSELVGAKRQVQNLALGTDHGCLITQDNYVHCWGINHNGQLGVGTKFGVTLEASPKALPVLRPE